MCIKLPLVLDPSSDSTILKKLLGVSVMWSLTSVFSVCHRFELRSHLEHLEWMWRWCQHCFCMKTTEKKIKGIMYMNKKTDWSLFNLNKPKHAHLEFPLKNKYADAFNSEEEPMKTTLILFIIVLTRSPFHLLTEALCIRYLYLEGLRCRQPLPVWCALPMPGRSFMWSLRSSGVLCW